MNKRLYRAWRWLCYVYRDGDRAPFGYDLRAYVARQTELIEHARADIAEAEANLQAVRKGTLKRRQS